MFLLSLIPSFQTFMSLVVLLATLLLINWYKMVRFWKNHGIKAATPVPLLGNLMAEFKRGTFTVTQENIKKYGKVHGIHMASQPYMVVSDVDMIKQILVKDSHIFTNHTYQETSYPLENMLTMLEDDHWKHVRNSITPAFSGNKLKQMMSHINRCSDNFVKKMGELCEKGETFNMPDYTNKFTLDVIAATAFGIQLDCQNDDTDPFLLHINRMKDRNIFIAFLVFMFPWIRKVGSAVGLDLNFFPKETLDFFVDIVERAMKGRKDQESSQTDFLQLTTDSLVDDIKKEDFGKDEAIKKDARGRLWTTKGLTKGDIIGNAVVFFIAGNETTASTLSYITYCLATNMDVQEKLIAEIDEVLGEGEATYEDVNKLQYLDKVIQETMRLYPIAPRTDRICKEACTIKGVDIPAEMGIMIPISNLQKDPEVWPEPEKFDPERFTEEAKANRNPYYYMPFGMGPRICIGMRLALLEMKVVIASLLQKYKLVTCEKTEIPLKITKLDQKPENGIHLKLEKRL